MNRYEFVRTEPCPILGIKRGLETWVWIAWVVLLFMTVGSGFGLMGYMKGKHEERAYFTPLVNGMVKQVNDNCTSSPWTKRTPKNPYEN